MRVFLVEKAEFISYLEMYLSTPVLSWGRAELVKIPPCLPAASSRPRTLLLRPRPKPPYPFQVVRVRNKSSHHGDVQDGHGCIHISPVPVHGRIKGYVISGWGQHPGSVSG